MDNESLVNLYDGKLFSCSEKLNYENCQLMDGARNNHPE